MFHQFSLCHKSGFQIFRLFWCLIGLSLSCFASAQSNWTVQYFNIGDEDQLERPFSPILDLNADYQTVIIAHPNHLKMQWRSGGPKEYPTHVDKFGAQFHTVLTPGQYTISISGDDGIRARFSRSQNYFIDQWRRSNQNNQSAQISVPSGQAQELIVEYFEGDGEAQIEVIIQKIPSDTCNTWYAEIFDLYQNILYHGDVCSDSPNPYIFSRNWGQGSPRPGIPSDNFSMRLQKQLPAGYIYNVNFRADDGIKIITDHYDHTGGQYWHNSDNNSGSVKSISGGRTLVIDYYEAGGNANLWVEIVPQPINPAPNPVPDLSCPGDHIWEGEHFNSTDFKNPYDQGDEVPRFVRGCGANLFNSHINHVNGHSAVFSTTIIPGKYRIFLKADDFAFIFDGKRSAMNEVGGVNASTSVEFEALRFNNPQDEWRHKTVIEHCLGQGSEKKLFIEYRDYPSSSGSNKAFLQVFLQKIGEC